MDRLSRDEESDGDIGERREFEVGGIADGECSGRNGDRGTAAEGKGAGGGGLISPLPVVRAMLAAPMVSAA